MSIMPKSEVWIAVLFTCFCLSCSSSEDYAQEILSAQSTGHHHMETQIHNQINQYRDALGLLPLEPLGLITAQAGDHNVHMITNKEVCHHGFGHREQQLGRGLGAIVVAENVGYGYQTAQGLVQAWLKSDAHKKNIVGDFDSMGIAASQNEDGLYYFTNIFVKR